MQFASVLSQRVGSILFTSVRRIIMPTTLCFCAINTYASCINYLRLLLWLWNGWCIELWWSRLMDWWRNCMLTVYHNGLLLVLIQISSLYCILLFNIVKIVERTKFMKWSKLYRRNPLLKKKTEYHRNERF